VLLDQEHAFLSVRCERGISIIYSGGVVSKGLLVAHHFKRDGIAADGEFAGGKWLHAGVEAIN